MLLTLLDGRSTKNDGAMLPTKALAPLEISSAIVRDLLVTSPFSTQPLRDHPSDRLSTVYLTGDEAQNPLV
jgi:hypothetical protein